MKAKPEATPRNGGVLKTLLKKAFVLFHAVGNAQAYDPYHRPYQHSPNITPYDPLALFSQPRHYTPAHSTHFNTIHTERGLRLSEVASYRRKIKQYDVSALQSADSLTYPEFTSSLRLENKLLSPTPSRKLPLLRREGESTEDYLERERLREEGCEIVAEEEAQYRSQLAENHVTQKSISGTGMDIEPEDKDSNSLTEREHPHSNDLKDLFKRTAQVNPNPVIWGDNLLKKKTLSDIQKMDVEETDIENDDKLINRPRPSDFSSQLELDPGPLKKIKINRRLADFGTKVLPSLKEAVQKLKIFNVGQGNGIILWLGERDKRACWIFDAGYDRSKPSQFKFGEPFTDQEIAYNAMYEFLKEGECLEELTTNVKVSKPIYILTTHADADHYNLVRNVFEGKVSVKDKTLNRDRQITEGGDKLTFIHPKECVSADCTPRDFGSDLESKLGKWAKKHVGLVGSGGADILLNDKVVLTKNNLEEQECATQTICFLNIGEKGGDKNSNSLVTRITFEGKHFLLPGDATWKTYEKMKDYKIGWAAPADKKRLGWILDQGIDYLVVPHHGAATMSSHGWIYKAQPKKGVVFSAPMYSHHHPTLASVYAAVCALAKQGASLDGQSKLIYWDTAGHDSEKKKVLSETEDEMKTISSTLKACNAYETYKALEESTELKVDGGDTKAKKLYSYNLMPKTFVTNTNGLEAKVVDEAKSFEEALIYHIGRTELPIYITGLDGHITFEKDPTGGVKITPETNTLFNKTTRDDAIRIYGESIEDIVNEQIKALKKPSKLNFTSPSTEALFLKHFAIR